MRGGGGIRNPKVVWKREGLGESPVRCIYPFDDEVMKFMINKLKTDPVTHKLKVLFGVWIGRGRGGRGQKWTTPSHVIHELFSFVSRGGAALSFSSRLGQSQISHVQHWSTKDRYDRQDTKYINGQPLSPSTSLTTCIECEQWFPPPHSLSLSFQRWTQL